MIGDERTSPSNIQYLNGSALVVPKPSATEDCSAIELSELSFSSPDGPGG